MSPCPCPHVPMSLCPHVPMSLCPYVPMSLCANAHMRLRERYTPPMRAIVVTQFGGPEELRLADIPDPQPAPGQVVVRLHAAGVNPYEAYIRRA